MNAAALVIGCPIPEPVLYAAPLVSVSGPGPGLVCLFATASCMFAVYSLLVRRTPLTPGLRWALVGPATWMLGALWEYLGAEPFLHWSNAPVDLHAVLAPQIVVASLVLAVVVTVARAWDRQPPRLVMPRCRVIIRRWRNSYLSSLLAAGSAD